MLGWKLSASKQKGHAGLLGLLRYLAQTNQDHIQTNGMETQYLLIGASTASLMDMERSLH
jgi:hypothetical protein